MLTDISRHESYSIREENISTATSGLYSSIQTVVVSMYYFQLRRLISFIEVRLFIFVRL